MQSPESEVPNLLEFSAQDRARAQVRLENIQVAEKAERLNLLPLENVDDILDVLHLVEVLVVLPEQLHQSLDLLYQLLNFLLFLHHLLAQLQLLLLENLTPQQRLLVEALEVLLARVLAHLDDQLFDSRSALAHHDLQRLNFAQVSLFLLAQHEHRLAQLLDSLRTPRDLQPQLLLLLLLDCARNRLSQGANALVRLLQPLPLLKEILHLLRALPELTLQQLDLLHAPRFLESEPLQPFSQLRDFL